MDRLCACDEYRSGDVVEDEGIRREDTGVRALHALLKSVCSMVCLLVL